MRFPRRSKPLPLRAGWGPLLCALGLALAVRALGVAFIPIQGYLIAAHEVFHALGGWLTGASVAAISTGFTEGATWTSGGWFPVISASGYLGSAAMGALLTRYCAHRSARVGMMCFCVLMAASLLWKGQWSAGLASALAINTALLACLMKFRGPALLAFLGCLFCAGLMDDIAVYVFHMTRHTDAGILARHLGAEWLALPIALGFALASLGAWALAARGLIRQELGAPR